MCTHGPHAHLLVDDVHSSQTVEAEAVEALLAWLVDRVESGAGILLLSAIQRAWLRGLRLQLRPWFLWTNHRLQSDLLLVGARKRVWILRVWKIICVIVFQRKWLLVLRLGEQQNWHADEQEDSHGLFGR